MNNKELDKVKKIELEVMKYFMDICKKNSLTYYIFYGTLLGCIRHSGFIPWDDDIDVVMPSEDYLKFLEIMKNEKSDKYYLQNVDNTKYCSYVFTKIRKYHTTMVEEDMNYLPFKKGINIDIFPLMKYPKNKLKQKIFIYRYRIALLLANRDVKGGISNKVIYGLLHVIPRSIINKMISHRMNKILKYNGEFDKYYINDLKRCFDKNWFGKLEKPFEKEKMIIPKDYDKVLTELYGDYMTPPPEDKRYGHGAGKLILSFDKEYDEL